MKLFARHDTLIAIIGTGILTAVYHWGINGPGRVAVQKIESEIAQSHATMRDLPLRMEERSQMRKRLEQQHTRLRELEIAVPTESHVSDVLHQVASQAQQSKLVISRLEPLPTVDYATYSAHLFHLTCRGTFSDISEFLNSLESQQRLVTFGKIDFTRGNEGPTSNGNRTIQANFDFNVYSRHAKSTKVAENTNSRASGLTDK